MYELEKFGIVAPGSKSKAFAKSGDLTPPAGKGEPWELTDGIKLGQTRTIYDAAGEPVLRVAIGKTAAIQQADPEAIYRVLVKRFPDGTVRQILIEFEHLLAWQNEG
jgi:hypothetical protein